MPSYEDETTSISVDLKSIEYNYINIRDSLNQKVECSAVVKANAYGLGANEVSHSLYKIGCRSFFVATAEEGKNLRKFFDLNQNNQLVNIYILNGPLENSINIFKEYNLIPVLNSIDNIEMWINFIPNISNKVALHIDTGMNRLGMSSSEIESISKKQNMISKLEINLIMSHFACAENPKNKKNVEQLKLFNKLIKKLPPSKYSIANSAASLSNKKNHYDMVRLGIALYGINPLENKTLDLKQAVKLQSEIIQIRWIKTSSTVGYGATYKANEKTKLATIPVGYADGYPRVLSNIASVHVENNFAPIVGRISMDLIVINITNIPAKIGSKVILFGGPIDIDYLAKSAGTVSYELLTRLSSRYPRVYFNSEKN